MWQFAPLERASGPAREENRMLKPAYALALAAAVLTAGCNETKTETTSTSSTTTSATITPSTTSAAPGGGAAGGATEGGKVHKLPSGLQYEDLVVGSGKMAEAGMNVSVNYTGWRTDGFKFDSSYDRGEPIKFQLGNGEMIKGWDEGVKGMRIGGKRKLTIPPDMAYGSEGRGSVIPPNSTLVFEVELVDVR
jgi:FKBP-type peptidyl-prolyl cis-trans isomerase